MLRQLLLTDSLCLLCLLAWRVKSNLELGSVSTLYVPPKQGIETQSMPVDQNLPTLVDEGVVWTSAHLPVSPFNTPDSLLETWGSCTEYNTIRQLDPSFK
ncbi:predicted protein [Aspergillus terreus NIH2624]|uniref:Uncharacterized protein n=1 Tax=Aspergillus terreus (strain NIH 2624 / FGSC A1156) TaxID=341663 RepID=Q0CV28_ASPTN|nr:uncharacterized protein ATEG_02456 [Aspergillus terreus NIH2624]EAU37418.1 predicted protein [Aspergillus terreus NIH2624]